MLAVCWIAGHVLGGSPTSTTTSPHLMLWVLQPARLKDAGCITGLDVLPIINEPSL